MFMLSHQELSKRLKLVDILVNADGLGESLIPDMAVSFLFHWQGGVGDSNFLCMPLLCLTLP